MSGSPSIDTGTCEEAPEDDLEGNARPAGTTCDMGAYEFPADLVPTFIRADANADGAHDLADAVSVLSYLFAQGAMDCLDAADVNDTGEIDLADPIYLLNYLFVPDSPSPAPPFEACGEDPTSDDPLDCAGHKICM